MGKFARGSVAKQPFIMGWCVSCIHGYHMYVCVFAHALTAIIDVSRDVDSRVVVISQTFK